jgi:hypothetical protein
VLHLGRLWPYPQTLTRLKRLAREKHYSLLAKSVNYCNEKFYSTSPSRDNVLVGIKLLMAVMEENQP